MRRADAKSRLSDPSTSGMGHSQGDPEVRYRRLTFGTQKDVPRLYIAVDDSMLVSVIQSRGDPLRDL